MDSVDGVGGDDDGEFRVLDERTIQRWGVEESIGGGTGGVGSGSADKSR